ncbi:hypothetical protein VNO78_35161 [Psophocarpus tetragonolobus]|uniref:Uncharacterized protein n=1 Tax=Psophocarpus tetragonolobus TaxID=3891 RepID=A0AAN9NU35_PSOTE
MVGVAIGFASTTASPAVAKSERERAARPTEVLKAFEAYTSLLHDLKKGSNLTLKSLFKGGALLSINGKISVRGVIRNPRKDRLRLPPRSHEDLYVLVQSRTTEIFRSACVGAAQIKKSLVFRPARLLLDPGMAPGEGAAMPPLQRPAPGLCKRIEAGGSRP